ncbi:MAG: hypothetical protein ACOX5Z_00370 [Desulfobulbus sp.]|jgi:hypothetical protein
MAAKYCIDIDEVGKSLREVQRDFDAINDILAMRREPMRDEIIDNMLAGYEYVNWLLDKEIRLLKPEGLDHFLELNNIVLCGADLNKRKDFKQHILANTDRFYEQREFSIKNMRRWAEKHKGDSPWRRAAGSYILQVSWPQLFFEGNHRTGGLLMSTILVRHGKPPFVLSVDNAKGYFDPSSLAKGTLKNELYNRFYKLPKINKRFAKFLEKQGQMRFLKKK